MKRWSWIKPLIFVLVTAALVVVMIEGAARLIEWRTTGERFTPETERVYNNLGYRPPDIVTPKPAGTVRICCVGDSFTWGMTPVDETYPAFLQTELDRWCPAGGFEVINCGVPARTTVSEVAGLLGAADALAPDVVVMQFLDNDLEPMDDYFFYGMPRWARVMRVHPVFSKSAIVRFFWRRAVLPWWYHQYERKRDQFRQPGSPQWNRALWALGRLKQWAGRNGVPIYGWYHPSTEYRVDDQSPELTRVFLRAVEESGIITFDPAIEYWRRFERPADVWCSPIEHHPNAVSNAFIANWISSWLIPTLNCDTPNADNPSRTTDHS